MPWDASSGVVSAEARKRSLRSGPPVAHDTAARPGTSTGSSTPPPSRTRTNSEVLNEVIACLLCWTTDWRSHSYLISAIRWSIISLYSPIATLNFVDSVHVRMPRAAPAGVTALTPSRRRSAALALPARAARRFRGGLRMRDFAHIPVTGGDDGSQEAPVMAAGLA